MGFNSLFLKILHIYLVGTSQVALVVKNPPANAGDIRDRGSIPGLGRSPGGGHGNPILQYSCLENRMDRGSWWATVHGSHKGTLLKRLSAAQHLFSYLVPRGLSCGMWDGSSLTRSGTRVPCIGSVVS